MRDTGAGGKRGTGSGARGRQTGYGREPAPRSQARPGRPSYEPPRQEYGQKPARRKRKFPVVGVGVLVLLAVIGTLIAVGVATNAEKTSYYTETITAGVRIDDVEYGGWEVERLGRHLKDQYQKKVDAIEIKVTWQDQAWTFGGEDLGATHNVDEVVSKAALLARVGSLDQRRAEAKVIKQEGRKFYVQFALDPEALRAALAEKTAAVAHPGSDALVVFNPNLVDFTIPKDIEDLKPSQEEIDKMFLVTPEVSGKTVDVDMMVQRIMEELGKGSSKVELELMVTDFVPQVTEADIRKGFRLINAYRTKLPSTRPEAQPRIDNIKLALSKFNGLIFKPGVVLSFNETTGERSEANGYLPAPTIGGDKSIVDDYGGGVCQASTTLYNAALMSGCEILKRQSHSFPSSYAWRGFDAMVNFPNRDLQFKNVSGGNLYIKAYVKEPYVYVMVFGEPLQISIDGKPTDVAKITRVSEEVYMGPPPQVKIIIDEKGDYAEQLAKVEHGKPYVRVSGQPEMRYKTYLVYWDANGNEITRKLLYEDHFKEITREEVYSQQPDPTEEPSSTAEPQG